MYRQHCPKIASGEYGTSVTPWIPAKPLRLLAKRGLHRNRGIIILYPMGMLTRTIGPRVGNNHAVRMQNNERNSLGFLKQLHCFGVFRLTLAC